MHTAQQHQVAGELTTATVTTHVADSNCVSDTDSTDSVTNSKSDINSDIDSDKV